MIGMVADAERSPDDRRDALGGPDITSEAERLGPLRQQHRYLRPLLVRQLRDRARQRSTPQRVDSTLTPAPHPLTHRSRRHPQYLSDRLLTPARLFQRPGPQPTRFTPLLGLCNFLCHTSTSSTVRTTFSCQYGDQ